VSRPLRVGDRVTATGTVTRHGTTPEVFLVKLDGAYSDDALEARALTLLEPAEPPVNSVVVKSGVSWVRNSIGSWVAVGVDLAARKWSDLSDGEVIFEPEPLADWERELLGGGA